MSKATPLTNKGTAGQNAHRHSQVQTQRHKSKLSGRDSRKSLTIQKENPKHTSCTQIQWSQNDQETPFFPFSKLCVCLLVTRWSGPVTKSNVSLQILQARRTEKNNWRTQGALSCTLSLSHSHSLPALLWDCRTADIKFPDFSIFKDCPLILMTMQ